MKTAKVLWGATEWGAPHFSSDILWRTGFRAPAPIFSADLESGVYVCISSLEFGRAKKEADRTFVRRSGLRSAKADGVLLADQGIRAVIDFLKKKWVRRVEIPETFPYALARSLEKEFSVVVKKTPMYPERLRKTKWEIGEIRRALDFLRACRIRGDTVIDGARGEIRASARDD
jgi:hypothetical protein